MWEASVSASKVKRSLSRLSRQTFSPVPGSPTWGGDSGTLSPKEEPPTPGTPELKQHDSAKRDQSFLQEFGKLLSDFDEMHVIGDAPLDDQRVITIRNWVEEHISRLYSLADENDHLSYRARRVRTFAEEFLCKFADINIDDLRAKHSPEIATEQASTTAHESQTDITSSNPSAAEYRSNNPKRNSPAPMRMQNQAEGSFGEKSLPNAESTQLRITPEQEAMFAAIHDMLASDSTSIFEPPAALPPQEVEMRLSSTDVQSLATRTQEAQGVAPMLPSRVTSGHNVL